MKYMLLGYGKMGKAIEKILSADNNIIYTIDNEVELKEKEHLLDEVDMAFEFSTPSTAINNILTCFKHNVPVICGTTGWNDKLMEIKNLCNNTNQTLLHAPNFSIGINIFLSINEKIAELISKLDMYNISISETHHIHKKDAPSGTALKIKETIQNITGNSTPIDIISYREGEVVGIHDVCYTSSLDTIEIKHTAASRDAFAYGAVMASKLLHGKKGFYTMQDIIK